MDDLWLNLQTSFSWDMVLRLFAACLGGGVLGWEREWQDKPAGLRTHMLVALGAAIFMVATIMYADLHPDVEALRIDPTRVIAGIIGGVGFLGAGTIIEARGNVQGITTAAGIWVAAAVGMACGMGMYGLAITSVLFTVGILAVVGYIEQWMFDSDSKED